MPAVHLMNSSQRSFLENVSRFAYANPFLPERVECERALLGAEFVVGVRFPSGHEPRHPFACFRQIQRAFEITFRDIIGSSLPAARLRASVWQSIFTHDMRRYRRTLYARMGEFATLITGPSGTGKELAARAIAESRYVPFDERRFPFWAHGVSVFFSITISGLSPPLVEGEFFCHR